MKTHTDRKRRCQMQIYFRLSRAGGPGPGSSRFYGIMMAYSVLLPILDEIEIRN